MRKVITKQKQRETQWKLPETTIKKENGKRTKKLTSHKNYFS